MWGFISISAVISIIVLIKASNNLRSIHTKNEYLFKNAFINSEITRILALKKDNYQTVYRYLIEGCGFNKEQAIKKVNDLMIEEEIVQSDLQLTNSI